jgi:glycosyltransferase involved in cell wall biosynthesis
MIDEPLITFLLPFYNEEGFIGRTVASLAGQTDRRFRLLMIDNGSTDRGRKEALAAAAVMPAVDTTVIEEPAPGKIFALKAGLAEVTTRFVATIDADTIYPPTYVATCLQMFERNPGASCVIAVAVTGDPYALPNRLRRLRTAAYAILFRNRAHGGGCGQAFAASALRKAGGFDPTLWPFVLEDHEVIYRVAKTGPILHGFGHYCSTADRRADRSSVSWNCAERIAYKLMPRQLMGWYFHRFLAARFRARGKQNSALRSRGWDSGGSAGGEA